jgi:hypothetical protein
VWFFVLTTICTFSLWSVHGILYIIKQIAWNYPIISLFSNITKSSINILSLICFARNGLLIISRHRLVRDYSAVWRLLWICCSRGTSEGYTYGKQLICLSNSWSAHFHVSWLSDFIFYQKPLYKSLHQSFFYSFITILPSERGVTLHYSTIFTAEESRTSHRCDIALRNPFLQNKSTIVHMFGTRKVNT